MIDCLNGKLRAWFYILLPFILSYSGMSAQIPDFAGLKEKAYSEFINGSFSEALEHYTELGELFSQNPEYHYYIGRCLLELDRNAAETIDNLRFAAIKGEQDDAWFFLGKAYHLNGEYEKAVGAYKRYMRLGKKSDIRRLNAKELLYKAEKGQALLNGKSPPTAQKDNTVNVIEEQPGNGPKNILMSSDESDASIETKAEKEDVSAAHIDPVLIKAMNLQLIADSLNRTAKTKRADLKENELAEERSRLTAEISRLEKESYKIQKEADRLFADLQEDTTAESGNDTIRYHEFIELKEEINGIRVYQYKTDAIDDKDPHSGQKTDTSVSKDKNNDMTGSAENDLFSLDKDVYSDNHPVPERNIYPDRLIYHIQLGVFSKKLDHGSFGTIAPIYYEELEDKGLFKYYAGLFFSYKAASEAHNQLKSVGYPDSFVVAFHEGEQISVEKARQIEYTQIKF